MTVILSMVPQKAVLFLNSAPRKRILGKISGRPQALGESVLCEAVSAQQPIQDSWLSAKRYVGGSMYLCKVSSCTVRISWAYQHADCTVV